MRLFVAAALFGVIPLPVWSEDTVKSEPLEPVIKDEYEWIDDTQSWIYDTTQGAIVWFDHKFASDDEEVIKTPPSRFRLGLYTEFDFDKDEDFKLVPVVDFKTDIDLPNLERRLKVFISTQDPTALPGEDITDSNNALRVGATRDFFKNWDTSIGVKARWPPEPFANVQWRPIYSVGEAWTIYPKGKLFWDTVDRFGGLTSIGMDRWQKRWLFRQTASAKWSQEARDDDSNDAKDPTNFQFGEDGKGYSWSLDTVVGYVPSLLEEDDYGKRVSGSDVADGWGFRYRLGGNAAQALTTDVTIFRKGPLYKNFVYYVIAPQISWEEKNSWEAEYSIQIGVEVLMWGDDPLR